MKKQKQVRIIALSLNNSLGIINATKLEFDKDNKLIKFKGEVGSGKTTVQKAIQLSTQGAKALTDKQLYGSVDLEVQLLDGDLPLWVGCKSGTKGLVYSLYAKDENGKKINKPIIDGVEAKPAEYLKTLQTALTWRMDELTSESPSVQKKILLQLYQSQLSTIGVIFDKKHPDYELSILGQIDKAVKNRDEKDYYRKTKGGIAEDLKAKGHDPDRPESCPDSVNISAIESEIKALEKEITTKEAAPELVKKNALTEIQAKAGEITNKCLAYNSKIIAVHDKELDIFGDYVKEVKLINSDLNALREALLNLELIEHFEDLIKKVKYPKEVTEPITPNYIQFDEKNNVTDLNIKLLDENATDLVEQIYILRGLYQDKFLEDSTINTSELTQKIATQEQNKKDGIEINKIVDAIDSFHQWRKSNEDVVKLKSEYVKLLAKVDTGVNGLEIIPNEDDIFLMYNGAYDNEYFNNPNLEMRKLSSYSGTQKPVICLLIQDYLLSKKPKAMRYMFIDDIPHDNKTRELLEDMTEKLDLNIFLNWTGDFEQNELNKGEILIQNGEVFFR